MKAFVLISTPQAQDMRKLKAEFLKVPGVTHAQITMGACTFILRTDVTDQHEMTILVENLRKMQHIDSLQIAYDVNM